MSVLVAVLTYKRPELLASLLAELDVQLAELATGPVPVDGSVLVVDNDPAQSARAVVEARAGARYVPESEPGITAARNRALDEAAGSAARVLVFVDDDELPRPGWLAALVRTWRDTGAAAVAGAVVSEYEREPGPWVTAGEFFRRRRLRTGTPIERAATNNLLLELAAVRSLGLRFDAGFGTSGGEDTLFTAQLAARRPMVWCDEAVVVDRVPVDRVTPRWVLLRALSSGNSDARVDLALAADGAQRAVARRRALVRGSLRTLGGVSRLLAGLLLVRRRDSAKGARTAARGLGMLTGALGWVYHEYRRAPAGELVVLQSFPAPRPTTNPYVVMLARSLRAIDGVRVLEFSWRRALLSRYDVFHVHWPETLTTRASLPRRAVLELMYAVLLLRLRLRRVALVRTVHNLELPSDLTVVQRILLRLTYRMLAVRIAVNPVTPEDPRVPTVTIPHGHYRDWFARYPRPAAIEGRVGFVGLVRRYKAVPTLVRAFAGLDDPALSLDVAGNPSSAELSAELAELAAADKRVGLDLRYLPDEDFVAKIGEAALVVLPYPEMHNSGGVLAALSLDRPVLVPDNEVNRRLADEVGPGWVLRFPLPLRPEHLADALATARTGSPDLSAREWPAAGVAHIQAYREAIARVRGGRAASRSRAGRGRAAS